MLIYNYKKEFLGIDEADLETFDLSDLADLRAESADFADLFIKTPGCIHNFKHVHWIDYVLDKDGAEAKVIIHIKNKNYAAKLEISTLYLVDNPSKKAHAVNITDVKQLTTSQSDKLSNDILSQAAPQSTTASTELFTTPGSIVHDVNSASDIKEDIGEASFDPYETEQSSNPNVVTDIYESNNAPLDVGMADLSADVKEEDIEQEIILDTVEDVVEIEEVIEEVVEAPAPVLELADKNDDYAGYIYKPKLASEELGLPVDLIEEFVNDFIDQANSFKDELYNAAADNDLDTLKIQSHKLKGVAANLRIEDALDALKIINSTSDIQEVNTNLDRLYVMVTNLKNAGQAPAEDEIEDIASEDENDDMILSFKDTPDVEIAPIKDSDVPQNIEIAELADDEFISTPVEEKSTDIDLSILDEDIEETVEELQEEALDIDVPYDKEVVAKDIGLDIGSFNELFDDYMKDSTDITQTIIDAASNNDLAICKTMASKLKGMSENMRIHKFDDELQHITESSNSDEIISTTQEIISKLNQL